MKLGQVKRGRTGLINRNLTRVAALVFGASAIGVAISSSVADENSATRDWLEVKEGAALPAKASYSNEAGQLGIVNESGDIQLEGHPFFEPHGEAGRACVTCHQPADAMSLSLETIQQRWDVTQGADPLFHTFDGANCPDQPRGERISHSLLLDHGLIRSPRPWPPRAEDGTPIEPEFTLEVVSDPAGCNTSPTYGLNSDEPTVSVYRRPRMAANLRYITTSFSLSGRFNGKTGLPLAVDPDTGERVGLPIMSDARATTLKAPANDALASHMRLVGSLTDEQVEQILERTRCMLRRKAITSAEVS